MAPRGLLLALWLALLAAAARADDALSLWVSARSGGLLGVSWAPSPSWLIANAMANITSFNATRDGSLVAQVDAAATAFDFVGLQHNSVYTLQVVGNAVVGADALSSGELVVSTTNVSSPAAPPIPQVLGSGGGFLRVRVSLPGDTGGVPISSINLVVQSQADFSSTSWPHNASEPEFAVFGLSANTQYRVRAYVANDAGLYGTQSEALFATTSAAQLPGSCPPPTVLNVTGGSISLQLNPPTDDGGASIIGYLVYIAVNGSSSFEEVARTVMAAQRDVVDIRRLPGPLHEPLRPRTRYDVRAVAINIVDICINPNQSVAGDAASVWTSEASLPEAPPAPYYLSSTGGQASIQLMMPANMRGAILTGFSIMVNGTLRSIVNTSTEQPYNVNYLSANSAYSVQTAAVTDIGTSIWSASTVITTGNASRPSPPLGVSVSGVTSSRALIRWLVPIDSGGVDIAAYRLSLFSPLGSTSILSPGPATQYELNTLVSRTTYTVKISAINAIQLESSLIKIEGTTFQALAPTLPSEPTSVQSISSTGGSIEVAWQAPQTSGGTDYAKLIYNVSMIPIAPCFSNSTNQGPCESCSLAQLPVGNDQYSAVGDCFQPSGLSCPDGSDSCCVTALNSSIGSGLLCRRTVGPARFRLVTGGATYTTFSGLNSSTTYYFGVQAINQVGRSKFSSLVGLRTRDASPPGYPSYIRRIGGTGGSVSFQWDPPLDSGGSAIVGYHIYRDYRRLTQQPVLPPYVDCGGDLLANTQYLYGVAAVNASRIEGSLGSVLVATPPVSPPQQIGSLSLSARTISWLNISVTPGCDGGGSSSLSYQFLIAQAGSLLASGFFPCCNVIVTGLEAQQEYNVSIRVSNEAARLEWVNITFATSSGVPAPPNMVMQRANTYSMILSADSASLQDREVLGYELSALTGGNFVRNYSFSCDNIVGPGQRACSQALRLDGLGRHTTYQVLSRAIGPKGPSDWSNQSFTTGNESIGIFQIGDQAYTATSGGVFNITIRRLNGTAGNATIGLNVTQPDNVLLQCDCVDAQGCSCGLQLRRVGISSLPGSLVFVDGQDSQIVKVSVWEDDPNTTQPVGVLFSLIGSVDVLGTQQQAVATVVPSQHMGFPSFSRADVEVLENATFAKILIARLNGSSGAITFDIESFDISSNATRDYVPVRQTINMGDRQSLVTLSVQIVDNQFYEGSRMFGLKLRDHPPSAVLKPQSINYLRLTIVDDEDPTMILPPVPIDVEAVRVTGGEIELAWQEPNATLVNMGGYLVRVSTPSNGTGFFSLYNASASPTFILSSLQPRTLFRIQLAAWNLYGASEYSDIVYVQTTAPSPPSMPQNFHGNSSGGSFIQLSWDAPRDLGGGIIVGYIVSVQGDDGTYRQVSNLTTPSMSLVVQNLSASTVYNFSLAASTTLFPVSSSSAWAFLSVSTGPPTIPKKPPTPALMRLPSAGTLSLFIREPDDLGGIPPSNYSLFVRTAPPPLDDQEPLANVTVDSFRVACSIDSPWVNGSLARSCTVYKLLAGTSYEVYVVLKNAVGASAPSDRIIYSTASSLELPSAPENFRASRVTGGNIYLVWDLPLDLGGAGDVLGYTVFRRTSAFLPDSYFIVYDGQDSTERQVPIKGLVRASTYAFAVVAQTGASYCANLASQHLSQFMMVATLSASQLTAPQSLVQISVTGGSITIGWSPPDDLAGLPLRGYLVDLLPDDTGTGSIPLTADVLSPSLNRFTHYGLKEQTTYTYTVTAINFDGPGMPSAAATFTTATCTPPDGVKDPRLVEGLGGQITIAWEPPLDTGGRAILYYQVTRTDQPNNAYTTSSLTFTDSNGLIARSQYIYYIRAFNGLYTGQAGGVVTQTGGPNVSDPPLPLQIVPFGGRIELNWTSASNTGGVPITAFAIRLLDADGSSTIDAYRGLKLSYIFQSLQANTTYKLQMLATNEVGDGPVSEYEVHTTEVDLPSAPPQPSAFNISGGSMTIKVYPPSYTGGDVVTLQLYNKTQLLNSFAPGVGESEIEVSGLTARTVYRFRVVASNSRGQTTGQELVVSTTDVSVPSVALAVQRVDASYDRLWVSWPPVADNGGDVLLKYELTYFECDENGTALSTAMTTTSSSRKTVLLGLMHTSYYSIAVRAMTSTGLYGDSSPSVILKTEEPLMGRIVAQAADVSAREDSAVVLIPLVRVDGSFGYANYTYELFDQTAAAGSNYVASSGVGWMESGVKAGVIEIALINDNIYNPDITFLVEVRDVISNTATQTIVTIQDDGDAGYISFSSAQYQYLENSGTVSLPITRNGGSSPVAVIEPYIAYRHVALASRFTLLEQNLTFDEGVTFLDLTVQIEDDETFQYWPDSVNISFRILSGGVLTGDYQSANLTALDDGDVSPPKPITGLKLVKATGGSIELLWSSPVDRGGAIVDLTYQIDFSSGGQSVLSTSVVNTTALVYGLTALTTYQFTVTASNQAGNGPTGNPLILSTTKPTPPSAPLNVDIIAASSSTLLLTWDPPMDSGGSPVVGYTVYNLKSNGLLSPFPSVSCFLPTLCSVKGLVALTGYSVQVRASTAAVNGTGALSPATVFQTSTPDVPDPPPLANVTWVSAGAMTIKMFNPLNVGGSDVSQYRLSIRGPSESDFRAIYQGVDSSWTEYRLDRLTSYEIKYQAINSVGLSDFSPVLVYQTLERSLVSAPQLLTLASATGGAIEFTWTEPLDVGGRSISGYNIMMRTPWIDSYILGYDGRENQETRGVVYGLNASTIYSVYVVAFTEVSNCFSPKDWVPSSTLQVSTTAPTLPTPAPVLLLARVTGGLVELTWNPPNDQGGVPMIGYTVSLVSPTGTIPIFTTNNTALMSFTHNDLIESTVYTYLITGSTRVGNSPQSDPLVVKTLIATAPSAPLNIRQLPYVSGGAIQIGWSRPIDTGGQPLRGYWVYRDGVAVAQDLPADARDFIDKQSIKASTSYEYTVRAFSWSTMGSELSAPFTAASEAATRPRPPMLVSNVTSASFLVINWSPDPDTGGMPVTLFEAKLLQGSAIVGSYLGLDQSYRFTGLKAATNYNFTLLAYNQIGVSDILLVPFRTVLAFVPDTPPQPVAIMVFGGNMTVTASTPVDTGGLPVIAMRFYEATLGFLGSVALSNGMNKAQFTLLGLVKNTAYSISTGAVNDLGEGARGTLLIVLTGSTSAPGPVLTAPRSTATTGTTISIEWDAPADSGGDLSLSYEIRYVDLNKASGSVMATVRSATLTSLSYSMRYNISVRVINSGSKSAWGPTLTVTTLPDAAGEFSFVTAMATVPENGSQILLAVQRINGLSGNVTVTFEVASDSATVGADFAITNNSLKTTGTVFFPAGKVLGTIAILIYNDNIFESPNEQFFVRLKSVSMPVSSTISTPKLGSNTAVTVTILDDGDAGVFSFNQSNYAVREDAVSFDVPIIREGAKSGKIVLAFTFQDITATANRDYRKPLGQSTIEVPNGATNTTFRVYIINDKIFEFPDETFAIYMTALDDNVRIGRGMAVITILDDGDQNVAATPPPPVAVSATGGSVRLTLPLPYHNGSTKGVLTNYVIRIMNPATGDLVLNRTVPVTAQTSVGQLVALTSYNVSFAAANVIGLSMFSPNTTFSTTVPTLPGPPDNGSVVGGTGGSLVLAWLPPQDTGGVSITKYRIYTFTPQKIPMLAAELLQPTTRGVVFGLTANTTYLFAIQAGNGVLTPEFAHGWGAIGVPFPGTTPGPSLPGPVTISKTAFAPATGGSVTVSWVPPLDTGGTPVAKYSIYARNVSTGFFLAAQTSQPTTLSQTVDSLIASSWYELYVLAISQFTAVRLAGQVTGVPGAKMMTTTQDLTKSVEKGSVLVIGDSTLLVGDMANATKGSIPLAVPHVGKSIIKQNASTVGMAVQFANLSTGAPQIPDIPPPVTLVNATGGALTFRVDSPGDTGGVPIDSFTVFVDGQEPDDNSLNTELKVVSYLKKALIMRVTGLSPVTTFNITAFAVNSISVCDFSKKNTSLPVILQTTNVSQPEPPRMELQYVTGGGMKLALLAPFDKGGADITRYKLYMATSINSGDWRLVYSANITNDDSAPQPAAIVAGLRPLTKYAFKLSAWNGYFESKNSSSISFTTSAVSPPGPCAEPNLVTATGGMLILRWDDPPDNGGAPVIDFTVTLQPAGPTGFTGLHTVSNVKPTNYTFYGLSDDTEYRVSVRARNERGLSDQGLPATFSTTEATPPNGPIAVNVLSSTGGAAVIAFNEPLDLGGASREDMLYHVLVDRAVVTTLSYEDLLGGGGSSSSVHSRRLTSATTSSGVIIGGLDPSSSYNIQIQPENPVDAGGISSSSPVATTPPTRPSAPRNLHVGKVTGGSVMLTWTLPADTGGLPLLDYIVMMGTSQSYPFIEVCRDSITQCRVTELSPETAYLFNVLASNAQGQSPPTATINVNTSTISAPNQPGNIRIFSVSDRDISCGWTAPFDSGGSNLTGYSISVTDVTNNVQLPAILAMGLGVTITGLTQATEYSISVTVQNQFGASSASLPRTITTASAVDSPVEPTISCVSNAEVSLVWYAHPSAYIYRLVRNGTVLVNATSRALRFVDRGLNSDSDYAYEVEALINGNWSSSLPVTAHTLDTAAWECGGSHGFIDDVNYKPSEMKSWLLSPTVTFSTLTIEFSVFDLECDHDYLRIVKSDDESLVWKGGCTRPGKFVIQVSSKVRIEMVSDSSVQKNGFSLDYEIDRDTVENTPTRIPPPRNSTGFVCSGRGIRRDDGSCVCSVGYTGEACNGLVICCADPARCSHPVCNRDPQHMIVVSDELGDDVYGNGAMTNASERGTATKAVKSLSKALSVAKDGDLIFVYPGVYTGDYNRRLQVVNRTSIAIQSLKGFASTVIDCEQAGQAIRIMDSVVTMSGLTIRNARMWSDLGGSLSLTNSNVTIQSTRITSSVASQGGAIAIDRSSLVLTESMVTTSSASYGGGVYIDSSQITLDRSNITSCTAFSGGAIYAQGESVVEGRTDALIQNSSASQDGGGLWTSGGVSLNGITVQMNQAVRGGGILMGGGRQAMQDCTVINNVAIGNGGGVALLGPVSVVGSGNVVNNNRAYSRGGGLFITGGSASAVLGSEVGKLSSFDGNQAADGAGVFVMSSSWVPIVVHLEGAIIRGGFALNNGGGMGIDKGQVTLKNVTITSNTAGVGGGGLYLAKSNVKAQGTVIVDSNVAKADGGGLYVQSSVVSGGLRVVRNIAIQRGGGFHVTGNVNVSDTVIDSCTAPYGGGGYLDHADVALKRVEVVDCYADFEGGGLVVNISYLSVLSSTIRRGSAVKGGGIRVAGFGDIKGTLLVSESSAVDSGGGMFSSGSLSLADVVIEKAKAKTGAGIFAVATSVIATNVSISTCTASLEGGGWKAESSSLTLKDVRITDSHSDGAGGGLVIRSTRVVHDSVTITGNDAKLNGGGLVAVQSIFTTSPASPDAHSEIAANVAQQLGGNVYLEGNVSLSFVDIRQGVAGFSGGGVAMMQANVGIDACVIRENQANAQGGGLSLSSQSSCEIVDSTVTANSAKIGGGGASLSNSVLLHAGVVMERNSAAKGGTFHVEGTSKLLPAYSKATSMVNASLAMQLKSKGDGSGFYLAPNSNVKISSFDIHEGVAARGGIFVDDAVLTLQKCTFVENHAEQGSALYANGGSEVDVKDTEFTSGKASVQGGAVVLAGKDTDLVVATFADCVFVDNAADVSGGAMAISLADVAVLTSRFTTNSIVSGGSRGGAVFGTMSQLNLTECLLVNNSVLVDDSQGGTLFLQENSKASLERTSIFGVPDPTVFPRQGGAVYAESGSDVSLIDCEIVYSWGSSGGGLYLDHSTLRAFRMTIREVVAWDFGGAVYLDTSRATVNNSTFVDNLAYYDGGAILVKGTSSMTISSSLVKHNEARGGGGGVFVVPGSGATVAISDTSFVENRNRGFGSAISVGRKNSLVLSSSELIGNGGLSTEGGGLYAVDAKVTVDSTTFRGNTAVRGAAIELSRDTVLTMANSGVFENQVSMWGGAIYMSVRAIASISLTNFSGNTASLGGAMYILGSTKLTVRDSTMVSNQALSFGGATMATGGSYLDVATTTFDSNQAYTGGAISATQNAQLSLARSSFTNNSASDFGGMLYVDSMKASSDQAYRLSSLTATMNSAKAGVDIYWVYHEGFALACKSCGSFQIATSPASLSLGWWPPNVTSGVSLGTTKRNWHNPLALTNETGPSGGSGAFGPDPTASQASFRRMLTSSASSSSSGSSSSSSSSTAGTDVNDPDLTSPYASSLWPTLVVRDYYGAITEHDNRTFCVASKLASEKDKFDFYPPSSVNIDRGYMTFTDAQVLADTRTRPFELFVNCSLADDITRNVSIAITVNNCNPGYESVDGRCIPCKKGMYSLDGVKCHLCPLGATCEAVDESNSPVGVGIPARSQGFFMHESRQSYLENLCRHPSSWDSNDPCRNVDGEKNMSMTRRLQACSKDESFDDFWPRRRVFACLSELEYYTCDTHDACLKEDVAELKNVSNIQQLTEIHQCQVGYDSVTCATCKRDFYKVSNGQCKPCSDPNDPAVAKMAKLMAMIPGCFATVAFLLVWYYFSNSAENEIMKQARAARKLQIYDPNARPRSFILVTSVFIRQRVSDILRQARHTFTLRRRQRTLFQIEPRAVPAPAFRAEKFKILLGFFQIFGGFKKLYEIPWPDDMSRLMDIFSIADFNVVDTTGIECFIYKDYFSNYRLTLLAVIILLVAVTLLLSWGVVRYRVKLSSLPRNCVRCGLPVFKMLKRQPKTLVRQATMVSMLRIEHKQRAERMRRRSFMTRAKDELSTRAESELNRLRMWWNSTRAGKVLERFIIFTRLPASSSKHYLTCPTSQHVESKVLAMVVRSNLRLWRARVRLRLNYQSFQNKCIKIFFWVLLLFYPELSQRVIGMFYCDEIGSDFYMTRDKSQLCYHGEWLYYLPLTLFLIVVWVAGVPLLFWTILFFKRRGGIDDKLVLLQDASNAQLKQRLVMEMRQDLIDRGIHMEEEKLKTFENDLMVDYLRNKKLAEPSMVAQVGFIYHSYRSEFWWFEVWELGRKLFLNCVICLLAKTGANRIIAALIVFLVYLSVMLFFQPFKDQSDSMLSGITQIQLFITLFCGLLLKMGGLHMQYTVVDLLTYITFFSNVFTISFAVLSIIYEKYNAARIARRCAREDHRRAIQTHVRKLWLKAFGWVQTEIYLRHEEIRPMPFRVILELARRDKEARRSRELDRQLTRSLHADSEYSEVDRLSMSQIQLDLPRPGSVERPLRSQSSRSVREDSKTEASPPEEDVEGLGNELSAVHAAVDDVSYGEETDDNQVVD